MYHTVLLTFRWLVLSDMGFKQGMLANTSSDTWTQVRILLLGKKGKMFIGNAVSQSNLTASTRAHFPI